MAKPYFQSGATTYTFDYAEVLPVETEDRPFQIIGRTETGGKKVADLGDYVKAWRLEWVCTSDGSFTALKSFIRGTVRFAATGFTFVDSGGNSFTVRLMDRSISYRQVAPGHYRGLLELEEEIT